MFSSIYTEVARSRAMENNEKSPEKLDSLVQIQGALKTTKIDALIAIGIFAFGVIAHCVNIPHIPENLSGYLIGIGAVYGIWVLTRAIAINQILQNKDKDSLITKFNASRTIDIIRMVISVALIVLGFTLHLGSPLAEEILIGAGWISIAWTAVNVIKKYLNKRKELAPVGLSPNNSQSSKSESDGSPKSGTTHSSEGDHQYQETGHAWTGLTTTPEPSAPPSSNEEDDSA